MVHHILILGFYLSAMAVCFVPPFFVVKHLHGNLLRYAFLFIIGTVFGSVLVVVAIMKLVGPFVMKWATWNYIRSFEAIAANRQPQAAV